MTFRPNFGHFQVSGKNVTMNIYRRVRSVKNFWKCKRTIRTYKKEERIMS